MTPKGGEGTFSKSEGDAFASDWGGWEKQPVRQKAKSSKPTNSQKTVSPGLSAMGDSPDGVSSPAVGESDGSGGKGKTPLATSTPARPQGKSQVRKWLKGAWKVRYNTSSREKSSGKPHNESSLH